MRNAKIPVIGFAAYSGAGKTTLLTQIIPLLKQYGLRVGLIKHSHHAFAVDQPGKDSYRLRTAGAATVMLVSSQQRAVMTEFEQSKEPDLDEQLGELNQTQLDLILVEGFKHVAFPKIEVYRPELNKPLIYPHDASIMAIASNTRLTIPTRLSFLDLNQPQQTTDFILTFIAAYS